jgi:hypothetical protein
MFNNGFYKVDNEKIKKAKQSINSQRQGLSQANTDGEEKFIKTVTVELEGNLPPYRAAWFLYSKVNDKDEIINPNQIDSYIIIRDITEQEAMEKLETLKDIELYTAIKNIGTVKCKFLDYKYDEHYYEIKNGNLVML